MSSVQPVGPLLNLYRLISPLAARALPLLARVSTKLKTGVQGRQGLAARSAAVADQVRTGVWFHVTSVGEYEQARPIIMALKAEPDAPPIIVTHFSPSGYEFALKRPCADHHDYLPWDTPAEMKPLVALWQPRLLVFVKFDCWPNQVLAADQAGVPIVLLAGSLQPESTRLKPLSRKLYRDIFNRFAHIGVCTEDDRRRFVDQLKVSSPVTVTGDTRVEQVILRYESAQDGDTARRLKDLGGRLLILGSTWPPDEKLWLPILKTLLDRFPDLRVVLTPHEPLPHRLESLEARLGDKSIRCCRLSTLMAADTDGAAARVILVDSIGVLAEIYRAGHLAYVGGSFTTGVHNTMEPAVAKMPVLFGPVIRNAEEAGVLVRRGAGFVVAKPEAALAKATELLSDADLLEQTGHIALDVVLDQRGATLQSLDVIRPYVTKTTS